MGSNVNILCVRMIGKFDKGLQDEKEESVLESTSVRKRMKSRTEYGLEVGGMNKD